MDFEEYMKILSRKEGYLTDFVERRFENPDRSQDTQQVNILSHPKNRNKRQVLQMLIMDRREFFAYKLSDPSLRPSRRRKERETKEKKESWDSSQNPLCKSPKPTGFGEDRLFSARLWLFAGLL